MPRRYISYCMKTLLYGSTNFVTRLNFIFKLLNQLSSNVFNDFFKYNLKITIDLLGYISVYLYHCKINFNF